MFYVALALLACGMFVALSESARRGSASAQTAALFVAVPLLTFGGLLAGASVSLASADCRGGCFENPPPAADDWMYGDDPWQRDLLLAAALVGFAAVFAAVVWSWRGRHRRAEAAMLAAVAVFGAWAGVFLSGADSSWI